AVGVAAAPQAASSMEALATNAKNLYCLFIWESSSCRGRRDWRRVKSNGVFGVNESWVGAPPPLLGGVSASIRT
ncbi:MAG: hypothetical protein KA750_09650, partial [Thermoflexales bacterium]|nr:hypothetical protein [Thermoflexales bacterium]